jgi:hypothetical protein
MQALFAAATEQADVLLLCGDLTDDGLIEEAKICFWGPHAWKSRSIAIAAARFSTATHTVVHSKGGPRETCPSTTWPWRCSLPVSVTAHRSV